MAEYRLLGQLEVVRDRVQLELGEPHQRAILVALLIDANRVVSLDRLIDIFWPEEPPVRATATVQGVSI